MQETTRAVGKVRFAGKGAAALLLAFYCAPVLAANTLPCDEAADRPRTLEIHALDIADPDLTISVTDHGVTTTVVVQPAGDETRMPQRIVDRSIAPRANTILRQIFDESYSASELDELRPASAPDAKSIAELTMSDDRNEPAADGNDAELPALDADLPGISEDETLRYRRQMFRTDI